MKKYTWLLLSVPLLAVCCSEDFNSEKETPVYPSDVRIEIFGGTPAGSSSTRADEQEEPDPDPVPHEPSRPGYCNADMLKIFHYEGWATSGLKPSVAYQECHNVPVLHHAGMNNRNKWTQQSLSLKKSNSVNYGFCFPALAFTEMMKDRFIINTGKGGVSELSFSYNYGKDDDMCAPEVFFGLLGFKDVVWSSNLISKTGKLEDKDVISYDNGCFYFYNDADRTYTCPLTGNLYRIVSQLNLNITEVSDKVVERIELYASNVPTSLILCGKHGEYYPVTPTTDVVDAKSIQQKPYKEVAEDKKGSSDINANDYVRIASVANNDFKNQTASLSAFFLPSRIGRSLCLRVYFKPGAYIKDGKEIHMKDYPLQPARSAFLTGEDAIVYYAENVDNKGNASPKYDFFKADDNVKNTYPYLNGKSIYVYNVVEDKFYSYANVRVNLSGKFDNFFADREQTDVTIEVCPTFEKEHYFEIK